MILKWAVSGALEDDCCSEGLRQQRSVQRGTSRNSTKARAKSFVWETVTHAAAQNHRTEIRRDLKGSMILWTKRSNLMRRRKPRCDYLAFCSVMLKTASDEDSTMSLRKVFQWLIVLSIKYFFLIPRQNLCRLYPLPLVLSMWLLEKREALCSCPSPN